MRSVYLQKNKNIFKVHVLPAEDYAQSLGLPGAPKIKFVKASAAKEAQRAEAKVKQIVEAKVEAEESSSEEEESDVEENVSTTKVRIIHNCIYQLRDALFIRFNLGFQANFQNRKNVPAKESKHSF
jgi:hypothetical protein